MKKMRKLLPAFAMLLVSAIMMSTASFAWFTMNDEVTVTGMQVQAKASGNLLISKGLMGADATSISVDFGGTNETIKPITLDAGAWKIPSGEVDPLYGTTGALTPVTITDAAESDYYSEYIVYLATAGDGYTGKLEFSLAPVANADITIAKAYTVALYVVDTEANKAAIDWTKPDYKYNVEDDVAHVDQDAAGFVNTNLDVAIPSTYGKTASDAVGLQIIIRIYVDGALENPAGMNETKNDIIPVSGRDANAALGLEAVTAISTYNHATMKDYKFYTDAAGTAVYEFTEADNGMSFAEKGVVAYWTGNTYTVNHEATYVNNATVPNKGTSFSISFRVENANP